MGLFNKVTEFKAGGLHRSLVYQTRRMEIPSTFQPAKYVDSTPLVMAADDQGQTSQCAAYAMAGLAEAKRWADSGSPMQLDPAPLYNKAKTLDGLPAKSEGTTLEGIIAAAKALDVVPSEVVVTDITNWISLRYAFHKYGLVLLGFDITEGWNIVNRRTGFIGDSKNRLGGHAVLGCYVDEGSIGIINSWGPTWGSKGYGRLTREQFETQVISAKCLQWNPR